MKDDLKIKKHRMLDLFVIIFCISGIATSIYLFQRDLLQTINSRTEKNAGTVTIKHNTVQRRQADRMLWERLRNESPVYSGDLIRVAEASEAVLNVGNNHIELSQNTLIQINIDKDISHIEIYSGEMNLNTSMDELHTVVTVNGRHVQAGPGAKLNIAATEEGMALQVYEGHATLAGEGQRMTINSGEMIALDAQGSGQTEPAVIVQYPQPNARYMKIKPEPLEINFAWNRFNIESQETLELKIAEDRKFTRITDELAVIDAATAAIDTGVWYWRLSYNDTILSDGRITVVNASGPVLLNPAIGSLYRYQSKYPELRFRWSEIEGASYYLLEAADTPDFKNPKLNTQVWETLYINSSLGPGTWYWRVRPVFPGYEGSAEPSAVSYFRVEQNDEQETPVLKSPLSGGAVDIAETNKNVYLSWETNQEAASSTIQIADNQSMNDPLVTQNVQDNFFVYGKNQQNLNPGQYYWNVYFTNYEGQASSPSRTQTFTVYDGEVTPQPAPPPASPVQNANLTQPQAVSETVPETVAQEPVVQAPPKQPATPPAPKPSPPKPSPLLPEPANRQPLKGYRFGEEELRTLKNIVFSWSPVTGANGYIFSLYQETNAGRRQIVHTDPPITQTEWTLDNFSVLDRGTFVWQVEAVSIKRDGAIDRHGGIGENTFIVDIYLPGQVEAEDVGIQYGR